jgi:hypothetical protein
MTTLDVTVSALRNGATGIDQCGAQVAEVSAAALSSIQLDHGAFGLLCSFLVSPVMDQQQNALDLLKRLGDSVRAESKALTAAANAYETTDDGCTRAVNAAIESTR